MTTQPDSQFEEFWLQRLTLATAEPPYARTTAELLGTTKLVPVELPACKVIERYRGWRRASPPGCTG